MQYQYLYVFLLLVALLPKSVFAKESYSPYVGTVYPDNVYWGDTHLHTNFSEDAYTFGNRMLGREDAYKFARGETVMASNGMPVRLHRPLDFLVIADHAESMGVSFLGDGQKAEDLVGNKNFKRSVWEKVTLGADRNNDPGIFTAFSGYEWSACGAQNGCIHRVVIFEDTADKVNQILPFSSFDSNDPEALWAYLDDYQRNTNGNVMAIPHNGNLSKGNMFALTDAKGNSLNKAYANSRSRWEPLTEVTQIKGDSETHPVLSPTDEFAEYERMNKELLWGRPQEGEEGHWRLKYEYARSALKLGLQQQAKLGVNPFKFGMIGSTDSHTSLAAVDENNYWGKASMHEPAAGRLSNPMFPALNWMQQGWVFSASGYAGIWASENTREALFAAMKRKEVYATTGPRISLRFFGGWDYEPKDSISADLARIGYQKGVPMGGDLSNAPTDQSPRFLIRAVKDPDGANLDRVQVIKGWLDKKGEVHEKIYNVVLSNNRKDNWRGTVKPVGNTVAINNASYTNAIGEPELATVWKDPDFDNNELAFYYVRVIEIPTPRWTAYDANYFGLNDIPKAVPMVTQERAYSSPIWFTPNTASLSQ